MYTDIDVSMSRTDNIHIFLMQQSPAMGGAEMYMRDLLQMWTSHGDTISGLLYGKDFLKCTQSYMFEVREMRTQFDIIGNCRGLIKSLVLLPLWIWQYSMFIRSVHVKKRIDVMLVSGLNEKILITLCGMLLRIPVVWIEYGPLSHVLHKHVHIPWLMYRLVKGWVSRVVTPSTHTIPSLINDGGHVRSRISHVACGVTISQRSIPKQKKARASFVIGCVSRLTPEKGQEFLIRSLVIVKKHIPQMQCVIVGSGPDENRLKKLVDELGLRNHVEFTGFVKDIDDAYNQMDVCVFPTVWELEGFGLVPIEAMARGIPVVASELGPLKETVCDIGRCFVLGDVEDLAKSIIALYQQPDYTHKQVKKGIQKVRKQYDISKQAFLLRDVLIDAVHTHRNT